MVIMMKKKLVLRPLSDTKSGWALFLCCFVFYTVLYCGRLNYSAALAEIVPSGLFEKDAAGFVSTAFFVTYGAGMFVNGFLSDRLPPFALVGGCTFLAGLANLGMYLVVLASEPSFAMMVLIWALNGYIQSSLWPTMIRIVSTALPEKMRVGASSAMIATTALGTAYSYLISQQIIRTTGWRELFLIPGIILAVVSLIWMLLTRFAAKRCYTYEERIPLVEPQAKKSSDKAEIFQLLLRSGAIYMIGPIIIMAMVKDGITQWLPTILTEIFAVEAEFAVTVSTLIPFISIFGAALSNFVIKVWLKDEMKSSVLFFGASALTLIVAGSIGYDVFAVVLCCFALTILFQLGINTMQISLVPLNFAKYGKAATITGVLNSAGSMGCGLSAYLVGLIAKYTDWQTMIFIWAILCIIGGAISAALIKKWMRFKQM